MGDNAERATKAASAVVANILEEITTVEASGSGEGGEYS